MVFTESNRSSSSETDDISLILRHLLHRSSSSSSSSSSSLPSSSSPSMITPAAGKEIPLSFLSSSSSPPPPPSTGVTGVILPDNLRRLPSQPAVFSGSDRVVVDRISAAESSAGLNTSTGIRLTYSSCFPVTGGGGGGSAVSSSPVGPVESESTLTGSVQLRSFDNDTADEYDCESEEGPEAAAEEAQPEQQQRKPSKRSRAAEVHNLSEKRRRSRINEKMKALQNLIPNSNKTDKASMLDEAIEYLKQLQLQVQMLSMRNGVTLHPMCLPGVRGDLHSFQLNQAGMDFSDREGSMHTDLTSSLSLNQETQDPVFTLPNPYASPTGASIGNISSHNSLSVISPEFVFGLQSSLPAHLSPYHVPLSSEDICREDSSMSQQQLVGNHSETNSVETWELKELKPGTGARMRLPCDMRASYVNEDRSFEGCVYPERTDGLIEQSLSCDLQGKYHILSDKPTKGSGKT